MLTGPASKELTLWTHESTASTSDAVLNYELIADFDPSKHVLEVTTNVPSVPSSLVSPVVRAKYTRNPGKRLVVLPTPATADALRKTPNLQISILTHLATTYKINPRSIVSIQSVPKNQHVAEYMVLYFRDQYVSRSDMWRAACALEGQCVYVGKRITLIAGIRVEVREIWRSGRKRTSAYVSARTKPVFRSESARYLIFVQMSKEMWEFEEDGELFYNKAIDGFLPELFKRWKTMNAHHLVSIVLFTRVTYSGIVGPFCLAPPRPGESGSLRNEQDYSYHNDFYKIVVDNVSSSKWESTLTALKRELHGFQRDVMLQKMIDKPDSSEQVISGYLTSAAEGNLLEAINLAAHQFNRDYVDRDLLRTGTSMIFITAGSGLFHVNQDLLKLTNENLLGNGIGIDIVCLSKRPLHTTPIFKYEKDKGHANHISPEKEGVDTFEFVLPYICEISYYGDHHTLDLSSTDSRFQARLKMQELQMMGLMDSEMSSISLDFLTNNNLLKNKDISNYSLITEQSMDIYDDLCFLSPAKASRLLSTFRAADDEQPFDSTTNQTDAKLFGTSGLFGTSVPSSEEGEHFQGLYEKSKAASASKRLVARRELESASISKDSSPRGSARWSSDSMQASPHKPYPGIPPIDGSNKSSTSRPLPLKRPQVARIFSNPVANMMTLKSQPSVSTMSSAVTISSGLAQAHQPVVTKGFAMEEKIVPVATSAQPISAIPINFKGTPTNSSGRHSIGRKLVLPADTVGTIARSATQNFRDSPRHRRDSSTQSKASLAKLKNEIVVTEPAPTPWHVLENPCFPSKNISKWNDRSWRWAHISNRARKTGGMNWESMCAPAALPLTGVALVNLDELKTARYSENSYSIYINPETQNLSQKALLREMISQRLCQGYQLVNATSTSGSIRASRRGSAHDDLTRGPLGYVGDTIYLSHAQMEIHCITCDNTGHMIEVVRYVRNSQPLKPVGYKSLIWHLARHDGYEDNLVLFKPYMQNHNWNYVDQVMSGAETRLTESVKYLRARFVFIPCEGMREKRSAIMGEQFTDEEVRVAGVNKICELIQKAVYMTPAELNASTKAPTKPRAPINMTFSTLYPAAYISHEVQHFAHIQAEIEPLHKSPDGKCLATKDLSLYDISNEIQSDKGISIKDRLWHWRWYESSWVGSDFVTWLVERTDISSREEAMRYAQDLMDRGLFEHVQKKHGLLDGFYLYRLKSEYSSKTAKTWFGIRKVTPGMQYARTRAQSNVSISPLNSPVIRPQKQKQRPLFELTRCQRIDVDPHKKSYRPEFVTIHYDIVHNPENCFHIRLEWIAVTAKLVEETVQQWARIAEKYDLRLVEAPVDEAWSVTSSNPFRAPLTIILSLDPPRSSSDTPVSASVSQSSLLSSKRQLADSNEDEHTVLENLELWMARILKHWNFVLDQEAAHKFPKNADISYSWGKPSYRYTQYIHCTGMSICQITPKGFLWLTNRLYISRSPSGGANNANNNIGSIINTGHIPPTSRESSRSSPHLTATGTTPASSVPTMKRDTHPASISPLDPDDLRDSFVKWCASPDALRMFYMDAAFTDTPMQTPILPFAATGATSGPSGVSIPTPASNLSPVTTQRESLGENPFDNSLASNAAEVAVEAGGAGAGAGVGTPRVPPLPLTTASTVGVGSILYASPKDNESEAQSMVDSLSLHG